MTPAQHRRAAGVCLAVAEVLDTLWPVLLAAALVGVIGMVAGAPSTRIALVVPVASAALIAIGLLFIGRALRSRAYYHAICAREQRP
jgi:CBS-domain-containing membrane protein